jgi:hypothetical protein
VREITAIYGGTIRRGVFPKMERDEYREACGLNPSSIKQPSPKHVRYAYEHQSEATDAMQIGTAVHTLVWEPHLFEDQVVAFEGRRTGGKWDDFQAENEGRLILKQDAYERALEIGTAVVSDPLVKVLAQEGLAEVAVFTEECGLQCRGLLDWISTNTRTLCDLKVVASIDDRMFGNAVRRYGWDVSMACYRRWLQRESGKTVDAVKFIAVESKPPYDIKVVSVDEETLERGWKYAAGMIERIAECCETGVWPGQANGEEQQLFVPTYAMDEEEIAWEDAA